MFHLCLLLGWSCYAPCILQGRVLIVFFYYFWHLFCSCSQSIYACLAQTGGKKKEDLDSWFSDESQVFNMYANHASIVKVRPIWLLIVIWLLTQVSPLCKLICHVTHQVICCYTGVCWVVITYLDFSFSSSIFKFLEQSWRAICRRFAYAYM